MTRFDVGSGQSGSPLYLQEGSKYYVAGILSSSSSNASYFTRLTSARLDRLDHWMDQDDQVTASSRTARSSSPATPQRRAASRRRG